MKYVEMVAFLTLPEICKADVNEFSSWQIDISKAVSITTDGTPSMTGEKARFVNLFAREVDHKLIGFNCIIHKDVLCAKVSLQEFKDCLPKLLIIYL